MADDFRFRRLSDPPSHGRSPTVYYSCADGDKLVIDAVITTSDQCDLLIFDPPYSPGQISECYAEAGLTCGMVDTQNAALYKRVRDAAMPLLTQDAVVLSFGWNSVGMGPDFEQVEIMLVCHGGAHNDTICLAERRVQGGFCDHPPRHPGGSVKDQICCDCGGFDIEWMYRCHKHGTEYCRGCSCSICAEEDYDEWGEYEEDGPMDLEDQLDKALDKAMGPSK